MVDPACLDAITKAVTYVSTKTQDWPLARIRACVQDPGKRALEDTMHEHAVAGNLKATQHACRTWWTYVLAFVPGEGAV